MNLTYQVETDWAVNWLREEPTFVERLRALWSEGLGLSIITLAELYVGVYLAGNTARTTEQLQNFLRRVTVLDVDDETCRIFGRERARLKRAGQVIERVDLLIGATALRHGLTLLTNNRRHFERIEGLEIISVL